jgi:hypothetical protein
MRQIPRRPLLPLLALALAAGGPAGAQAGRAGTPRAAPPHAAPPRPAAAPCTMGAADRAWLERALAGWAVAEREALRLTPTPLPAAVVFDARCAFTAPAGAAGPVAWRGAAHGGRVALPDGKALPPAVTSFAAPAGPNGGAFFVMALPSVWRAQGVRSGLGLEGLMDAVLLHELTHTRQFYYAAPTLAELTRRYGLPDDLSDDSLQRAFGDDSAYAAAYAAERDLLYAAAAAPDTAEARRLAGAALARLRARRARWFVGDSARWAPLDEIFLTMEGLGQWAAYAWLVGPRGPRLAPAVAQRELRRGGRFWTQDEGLALLLAVDRLVPGWQALAFAERPLTAEALLERAAAGPAGAPAAPAAAAPNRR